MSADAVRAGVLGYLAETLADEGLALPPLTDASDLLADEVVDSFGLLELLGFIEERFGVEVEFDGPDGDRLTELGALCAHVATQLEALAAP